METYPWQTWNSRPFSVERERGKTPGTVILRFCGPFTVRDVYSALPPMALNQILELEPAPGEDTPTRNILDLTNCPFMDSSGLGMIVKHHVRCQRKGIKLVAVGMSPRVREVFKITRMDCVVPIVATVEEAESN
ncbi:MAG: STAS domain-containing protein [Terracidiphilus sp.]